MFDNLVHTNFLMPKSYFFVIWLNLFLIECLLFDSDVRVTALIARKLVSLPYVGLTSPLYSSIITSKRPVH